MKSIVTGMNGTVAPVLAHHLEAEGISTVPWDRAAVPTDDPQEALRFISEEKPDWFFHLAMGSPDWTENIAAVCNDRRIRFLFTSTVSVFGPETVGPLSIEALPDANDEYGRYKIECEERIRAVNPDALIVRISWQIGEAAGSNNMVDFLETAVKDKGQIHASDRWVPACAFLPDTAEALYRLMKNGLAGLYHADGNPGLSFFQIVSGLNELLGRNWTITRTNTPVMNNRMTDERVKVRPITERLREVLQ